MAAFNSADWRVAFTLRARQLAPRWAFWLLLAGYDVRDRSGRDYLYIPYLLAFWSAWFLAVLAFVAGNLASRLTTYQAAARPVSILLFLLLLLAWSLFQLHRAARRSPFIFTDTDAHLLCLTPLDRRPIALAWLLGEWPFKSAPFWLAAVITGFTLAELQTITTLADALRYLLSGVRALSVVLPLQLALLTLVWCAGAYRLQAADTRPGLRRLAPLLTLLLGLVLAINLAGLAPAWPGSLDLGSPVWWLFWPLLLPLQAALGGATWVAGIGLALAYSLSAGLLFYRLTVRLNLSRAAQETALSGSRDVDSDAVPAPPEPTPAGTEPSLATRPAPPPRRSPIPAGPGLPAILWKDNLTWQRTRQFTQIWPALLIVALGLGVLLGPNLAVRAIALLFWVQQVSQQSSVRLRDNLAIWWLWGQLPLPAGQLILSQITGRVLWLTLLSELALLLGRLVNPDLPLAAGWLIPPAVLGVALATTLDIARQSRDGRLLTGDVPVLGYLGLALGLVLSALPLLAAAALAAGIPIVFALILGCLLDYLVWQAATQAYRTIG